MDDLELEAIGVGPPCPGCGDETDWVRCHNAFCDDGCTRPHEWDDPLWYDPDDVEKCDVCNGAGGWWRCIRCEVTYDENEIYFVEE